MNKCLIIVSFVEKCTREFARSLASQADYIICADAGQLIARKYDIEPNIVIGDFDSTDPGNIDSRFPEEASNYRVFSCPYITYPAEKSLTDAEASMLYAAGMDDRSPFSRNYFDEITMLGGIGGRLDHTIGAISTVREFTAPGRNVRMVDLKNTAEFLISGGGSEPSSLTIEASPLYKFFSVISYDAAAHGVTISGAKYPLKKADLSRATSLGISNEIDDSIDDATGRRDTATIKVDSGELLVIRSSDF